jgi:hypothetical protein
MEPRSAPGRVRFLLPDLALALSLFAAFYALVFYNAPEQLFRDSDAGWHIITGERIITARDVPRVDEYSFSRPAEPWFAWEWAADVAMGAAHRAAGLRGVALLYIAAIAFSIWLWVRLSFLCGANFFAVCLLASPLLTTAQLHWLARPHLFSWLLLLIALLVLEQNRMHWRWAFVIGLLWANLHGSFFLLPVLCLFYRSPRAALAAIAASFVNPYGWHLHTHLFAYLRNSELLSRVAEFQSFNFHSEGAWQVGAVLLTGMAGFVCALAAGQWSRAFTLLLLSAMALRTARGLPVLAMAGLPLAAGAISAALGAWTLLPAAVRRVLDYGNRLKSLQEPLRGYVPGVILFALLALAVLGSRSGFPAKEFPVSAAEHIPAGARLLAPDKYGGYLIYRFKGAQKVYFDGRSDYYGAAFMKEFVDLVEVRAGYEAIVKKYGFTHALLPKRYSLIPALERAGWTRLYADDNSVLLQRNF